MYTQQCGRFDLFIQQRLVESSYASVYTCVCVLVYAISVCTLVHNKPILY